MLRSGIASIDAIVELQNTAGEWAPMVEAMKKDDSRVGWLHLDITVITLEYFPCLYAECMYYSLATPPRAGAMPLLHMYRCA